MPNTRNKFARAAAILIAVGLIFSAGAAFSGSISGKVTYDDRVPAMKTIPMDADPKCATLNKAPVKSEMLVLGDGNAFANVVVYLKDAPAGGTPPSKAVVVDQSGCVYKPHAVAVMAGQPIQFKNSDGILHNVHGLPKVNSQFNKAQPGSAPPFDVTFDKAEDLFRVKCDVHPWMETYVAVLSHPYFAVTGLDGKFSIDTSGLPDGTYTLAAKHHFDKFNERTAKITVSGGSATQDISFKIP